MRIYYLNTSGEWDGGLWEFDEKKVAYLSDSNGRLRSNNSILYYFVQSKTGNNINFNGTYKIKYDWSSYEMKKVRDEYDTTEWSYSCN